MIMTMNASAYSEAQFNEAMEHALDDLVPALLPNFVRVRVHPAVYDDRQTSPGELIDHREHADLPSVMGAILDEVVGPDVVGPAGPETDAGSVIEPEPAPLGLLLGNLQPLPPPDALNPLGVHMPAFGPQQRCNASIAVSAILHRQADDRSRQCRFVISATRTPTLGRAMLANDQASPSFRDTQIRLEMIDAVPAAGGA